MPSITHKHRHEHAKTRRYWRTWKVCARCRKDKANDHLSLCAECRCDLMSHSARRERQQERELSVAKIEQLLDDADRKAWNL